MVRLQQSQPFGLARVELRVAPLSLSRNVLQTSCYIIIHCKIDYIQTACASKATHRRTSTHLTTHTYGQVGQGSVEVSNIILSIT